MKKDVTIIGKFYLKNGAVLKESVVFDKDNEKEVVIQFIQSVKDAVKEGFRENCDFQITFGETIFRGTDISAVTFTQI